MNRQPVTITVPRRRGLPLWTAILGLLILTGLGASVFGALWFYHLRSEARLRAALHASYAKEVAARQAREEAERNAALALARNRQAEVHAQAVHATNVLGRLLQDVLRLHEQAAAVRSNDEGRRVARYPDLVASARRFYHQDLPALPAPADLTNRLEAVRRIEVQLADALGTSYFPEPRLAVVPQNAALWADQESGRVQRAGHLLAALLEESRVLLPPATNGPAPASLDEAIQQLTQAESAQRQRLLVEKTDQARADAARVEAEAEAARIRETAQTEARRLTEEASAEAQRIELETAARTEAALKEVQLQIDRLHAEMEARSAEQKREAELAAARAHHQDTTNRLAGEALRDDARMLELKRRASDPKVQGKLAAFLTPGLLQVGSYSAKPTPYSLSGLQSFGALSQDGRGLQKLAEVASTNHDKVRPRWTGFSSPAMWAGKPEKQSQLVEAQELLIELGPALVELGLLRP